MKSTSQNIRYTSLILLFFALNMLLIAANLIYGSVSIPLQDIWAVLSGSAKSSVYHTIILEVRFPQLVTAMLSGIALSVSGLLMQTLFKNPLAGPGILGVSSGASLGVALLSMGGLGAVLSPFWVSSANLLTAFLGAFVVLAIIILFASILRSHVALLIAGIMIGYTISAIIGFLQFVATKEALQNFVLWGMGNYSQVERHQLPLFSSIILIGFVGSILLSKPLDALLLGNNYAKNLGISIKTSRFFILLTAGLLTATATAYTGPIIFIGLAVPHATRLLFKTAKHHKLLIAILMSGSAIALTCNLLSRLPAHEQALPINIISSALGAPLVVWLIMRENKV